MNSLAILDAFDDQAIATRRLDFKRRFYALNEKERQYARAKGITPAMTPARVHLIEGTLLPKCKTAWHVEALERLVLLSMIIPTMQEIDEKANELMTAALHI